MTETPTPQLSFQLFLAMALALVLPVLLALSLAWYAPQWRADSAEKTGLQPVVVESAQQLAELFAAQNYTWPPQQDVPPLALQAFPDDLAEQPVAQKKALFFQALLPLVVVENQRLETKRAWLEGLLEQAPPSDADAQQLAYLLERYRVSGVEELTGQVRALLRHVDRVPVALVLAQAANESGWGSSRFVREANNLFGEWTWQADEGIAPLIRNADSRHYVRRFGSLEDSVRSYMYNINIGHAYQALREMRSRMRAQGQRPYDALTLATGLEGYSERGEEYVTEIQSMIRGNRLHRLGPLQLQDAVTAGQ